MIKNLVKIAFRNIIHDKIYSLINLIGLTLGITCSLFLLFFILDELSYDRFHEKAGEVYRVVTDITEKDNQFLWAVAQIPFGPAVKRDYPEVQEYVRISDAGRMMFKKGEDNLYEEHLVYSDSATFKLLTFSFIQGDPVTCLYEPNSIVLTRDLAVKYFGKAEAVGETITGENRTFKITGVIENIPKNTHLRDIEGFISWNSLEGFRREGNWGNFGVYTYLYTPGLKGPSAFEEKIQQVYEDYCAEIFRQYGVTFRYQLQNIKDIHLYSKAVGEAGVNGDISSIYIFSAVAFFMLLIASINYMNLSTARSMRRAREVGIRKVMGSSRSQLMSQFLTESILFTLAAIILSILIVLAVLPFFNDLLDKGIVTTVFLDRNIILSLSGIIVFVGVLSGSYPAFILSSYKSVDVLKSNSSSRSKNPLLRKMLVVLQFGISIAMIICTWIVYNQLQYLHQKDLGFDKNHIIRISMFNNEMRSKIPVLKDELKKISTVENVGTANTSPGYGIGKNLINVENSEGEMVNRGIDLYGIDYDYIPTMGLQITKGRNFSRDHVSDTSRAVLVTEAMADRMNWDESIGKRFQFSLQGDSPMLEVVGVVKNYHHQSLYDVIEPVMFYLSENNGIVHIKYNGSDPSQTLADIEKAWKKIFPNRPFEYNFLDQQFDNQYQNDERRGRIFSIFSVLIILIACLGLLGLSAYTTQQRTREIGIRKVNGASVGNIVAMISKDFILLIVIAIILAFPVAWYFMRNWLQNFAYRTEMSYLTFILAALMALIITYLTIGYHTIKAAIANPVNSLREE